MRSSADRFAAFAGRFCGLDLEPFQRVIAQEVFTARRELLVTMPRGNGKTSLLAALGLYKLLSTPNAEIYCCAASRDQARLLLDIAKRRSGVAPTSSSASRPATASCARTAAR